MLGAIIGDICGSTYEFRNEKNVNRIELFRKGSFPTDDSVMTVAVAKALMDSRGLDEERIRNALIDSMHYFGHLFPSAGYGGHFGGWLHFSEREPYNSWGNGSAMRVSSAGWLYDSMEKTLEAARISAEVTHNHPEGIKGAQAIAASIFLTRSGYSKSEIRDFVEKHFYRLDFSLDEIRSDYYFDVSCQGSCPQAIEAFLESKNFEDAIRLAISVGGDSDTIAAMTGGIAEAFYGIPEEMKRKLYDVLQDTRDRWGVRYNNSILRREYERFLEFLSAEIHDPVYSEPR